MEHVCPAIYGVYRAHKCQAFCNGIGGVGEMVGWKMVCCPVRLWPTVSPLHKCPGWGIRRIAVYAVPGKTIEG